MCQVPESFKTAYYRPYTITLIEKTKQYLNEHYESIQQKINDQLTNYCEVLGHLKSEYQEISRISISFLYTSLYFKEPAFRLEAHSGKLGVLSEGSLPSQIAADWLFAKWADYEEKLWAALASQNNQIKKEALSILLREAAKSLVDLAMIFFKYWADEWEGIEALESLPKASSFYITFGEYRDWQRTLYAQQPEIDLFQCDEDAITTFRKFKDKVYRKKTFKNMDLTHCEFIKCHFINTTFEDVKADDAVFIDCDFYDTSLKNSSFKGSSFIGCDMIGIEAEKLTLGLEGEKAPKDFYKYAAFENCLFKKVKIIKSNLSQAMLSECIDEGLTVEEAIVIASDFAKYVKEG